MSNSRKNLVETFNNGWTQGKLDKTASCLHNDVIFLSPDGKSEIRGKDKCLETFKQYSEIADTKIFDVISVTIDQWNDTAMVKLEYYIEYTLNEKLNKEKGIEAWTLILENGEWKIVWRALLSNTLETY